MDVKIAKIETDMTHIRHSVDKCTTAVEMLPDRFSTLIGVITEGYEKRAYESGKRMGEAEGKIIALETKVDALKKFMWRLITTPCKWQ